MPNHTSHYQLIKPIKTEIYNVDDVCNSNADIIDTELYNKISKVKNAVINNIPVFNADGSINRGISKIELANSFIVNMMPTPSSTYNNICYMYIGDSNGELETNNFYKCILDKTTNKYKWEKISFASSSTGSSNTSYRIVKEISAIPNL